MAVVGFGVGIDVRLRRIFAIVELVGVLDEIFAMFLLILRYLMFNLVLKC